MKKQKKLDVDFITCVPWKQIETAWGKREYKKFMIWMNGQTCLEQGAYLLDVNLYAKQKNRGVEEPISFD